MQDPESRDVISKDFKSSIKCDVLILLHIYKFIGFDMFFKILTSLISIFCSLIINQIFALEDFSSIQYHENLTEPEEELQDGQYLDHTELGQIIDLPFCKFQNRDCFFIRWKNNQGDFIGSASFINPLFPLKQENVLWFYNIEYGFHVIVRQSDLPLKNFAHFAFQNILFNENGVLVAKYFESNGMGATNSSWLSWSKENGLFLFPIEIKKFSLCDLNNNDYYLIHVCDCYENANMNDVFYVINANDSSEIVCINSLYQKIKDILIRNWINKPEIGYTPSSLYLHAVFSHKSWQCSLDDDCNIIGKTILSPIRFSWKRKKNHSIQYSRNYKAEVDFDIKINGESQVTLIYK